MFPQNPYQPSEEIAPAGSAVLGEAAGTQALQPYNPRPCATSRSESPNYQKPCCSSGFPFLQPEARNHADLSGLFYMAGNGVILLCGSTCPLTNKLHLGDPLAASEHLSRQIGQCWKCSCPLFLQRSVRGLSLATGSMRKDGS